jgi:uncharacterized protein
MKPSTVFEQHRETIRRLVAEHGMSNPRLFGSALHGDDVEGSDLDLLVDYPPNASLFDIVNLQLALQEALHIAVDLRTAGELDPKFRDKVLSEALSL